MKNAGLFSTIYLAAAQQDIPGMDEAQGRLVTLSQSWQRRDASGSEPLWRTFIKAALGNLGFAVEDQPGNRGLYSLYEDFGFQNRIALLYLVEPGANLDDESVGRFWPAKLLSALRERKLNWGILTDGSTWRLYSTKSAKPYEDHVELDLATALQSSDETAYALFERFFHAESFVPIERSDYDEEKSKRLKAAGLKAKRQKRATTDDEEKPDADGQTDADKEREAGIYLCRLDLDGEISEAILEARVKEPLLAQVDNVLRYICNGFIADTPRTGAAYTEEERREVFESSVKLLYRCLFLFYAEARRLLPSEERHADIYEPHSIQALCREARKFQWNGRTDTAGYDLWQQLKGLVQAVNEGDSSYGVMGYNGGLFDDQEEKFLGKHRLRNDFLAPALYWLAFVDPADAGAEDEYPIPYEDLEVRHLGEMYESILEFKVRLADTDYIRRRTKTGWQTIPAAGQKAQEGDTRIKAGDIFFGETALERKQSGSYYTPESLVRFLVGKAVIAPLRERWESGYSARFAAYLEQARSGYDDSAKRGAVRSAEELVNEFVRREVLTYKVCDPAMGSGHFLVAAANLMGDFVVGLLAQIKPVSGVPSGNTGAPNHWRRLITRHCLYGADLNPLAVNLAKLALWLNCFARDHKLTFLDHHLQCGNSLIGLRDLDALRRIPERRKDTQRDKKEAEEAQDEFPLSLDKKLDEKLGDAAQAVASIVEMAEDDTDRQREAFADASADLQQTFAPLADLHTAYLMDSSIRPADYARLLTHFAAGKTAEELWPDLRDTWQRVCSLRERHDFFHWPLKFPDVFGGQSSQGFSATVGNPPWDVLEPHTLEFYAEYDVNFRSLERSAAAKRIKELHIQNPNLDEKWASYEALFGEASAWFKEPAAYQALTKGKIDLYKAFLERFFRVLCEGGRLGVLCPSSIYTDDGATDLRQVLFKQAEIDCIYCVSNERYIFPNVHHAFRIVVLCASKGGETATIKASFAIDVRQAVSLQELDGAFARWESRPLRIPIEDIRRFSNGALSLMEFHSQEHVDVATKIYANHPLLAERQKASWNAVLSQEYNMTSDRGLFNQDEDGYPLYEGKMVAAFDHQYAKPGFWMKADIARSEELTSYWRELRRRRHKPDHLDHEMHRVAYRRIASSTNERAFLSAVLPPKVACPHTMFVVRRLVPHETTGEPVESITAAQSLFLCSAFNSFVCDFIIRLKITTGLDMHFVYSLPMPRMGSGNAKDAAYFWPIVARALRLICTTDEYAALWAEVFQQIPAVTLTALRTHPAAYGPAHEQALRERLAESYAILNSTWTPACGLHDRKPDRRDDGDRAQTRAELDALIAHLYGLTNDEFAYILDTFPVLRRKELTAFGEFQSKRKALEEFERFKP
jgi:hypothetical protein